jgi:putative oxidoreductase
VLIKLKIGELKASCYSSAVAAVYDRSCANAFLICCWLVVVGSFLVMSCVRLFLVELHASQWVGILLARLVVGSLFFLSGRGKLFVDERREQMRQTLREARIPFPELNAFLVSTVEFLFGLLLITGALTPLACVMLSGVMIVAISTTAIRNIKATSPLGWVSEFLYLPEVLCHVILVWVLLSGPDWFSVDHLILSNTSL